MAASFTLVRTDDETDACAALAGQIMQECLASFSCSGNCERKIDAEACKKGILQRIEQDSVEYYLIKDGDQYVGILSFHPFDEDVPTAKLYLPDKHRSKGYASEAFSFLEGFCRGRDLEAIWLDVNKNSRRSIEVYKIKGFSTMRMHTTPLDEACLMDDFAPKE